MTKYYKNSHYIKGHPHKTSLELILLSPIYTISPYYSIHITNEILIGQKKKDILHSYIYIYI